MGGEIKQKKDKTLEMQRERRKVGIKIRQSGGVSIIEGVWYTKRRKRGD